MKSRFRPHHITTSQRPKIQRNVAMVAWIVLGMSILLLTLLAISPHRAQTTNVSFNQETAALIKKADYQTRTDEPGQKDTKPMDRRSKAAEVADNRHPLTFRFLNPGDTTKLLSLIPSADCQIAVYYPSGGGLDSNLMAFEVGKFLKNHYKNVTTSFQYIDMGYSYLDSIRYVNNKLKLIVYTGGEYGPCRVQIWIYHKSN